MTDSIFYLSTSQSPTIVYLISICILITFHSVRKLRKLLKQRFFLFVGKRGMIEHVILMFSIYRGFGGVKIAVYQQEKDKSKERKKI